MADQEIKMDAGNKFLMVVSVLVLVAVVAFLVYHLAGFLGQLALGERDPAPAVIETVDQRIAPVGRVEVAAVDPDAAPAEPKPASEVYTSVCAACHNAGVAGAPRADDGEEWARRLDEKGLDTLVSHSINGFQAMPARGGNPNLSDEEVATTVVYILEQAGVSVEDDAAVEAVVAEAPAVEEAAEPAVAGDAAAGRERFAPCVSCHGAEGQGMGIFPKIAGQDADYIAGRLQQYRAGEQVGPNTALMTPHATGLSDEAIADLAAYVATLGAPEEAVPEDEPATEADAAVDEDTEAETAAAGDAEAGKDRFATCASCHGAEGQGMGIFPKIAGQEADYIAGRLQQYRAGEQVGPTSALMMPHATGLSDEAIADLAAYIASLP